MSIDPKLFTNYVNADLVNAEEAAKKNSNAQISTVHLLQSMLRENGSFPYLVLLKAGINVDLLKKKVDEAVSKLPKQDPLPDELYPSGMLMKILKIAQDNATAQKDSRVAQDHVLSALFSDTTLKSLLESVGLTKKKLDDAI